MNICVITEGYPTPVDPGTFVFVDQLVSAWADYGNDVSVICPVPAFVEYYDKKRFYKSEWEKRTPKGNGVKVYSPRFFRAAYKKIGFIDTREISYRSFQHAVESTIKILPKKPDILYAHFLPAGCQAGDVGKKLSIPSFCAFGESTLWSIEGWSTERISSSLSKLSGMISVSTENKRILIEQKLFRKKDIGVFPNGVDHSLFKQGNRREIRTKYGFPEDAFIGAYTGSFNNDKGVLRAQAAATQADNVYMIYIGGGKLKPEGNHILFQGKLQHETIPEYLSAADFFILPTRAEGCCNAIIEAMACGLPVISAKGAYNDDILTEEYSIRTDPDDILQMAEAIRTLRDDPARRQKMSQAACEASKQFDIQHRASAIIDFMRSKMQER